MEPTRTDQQIYHSRPLLNKAQGRIHVIDLMALAVDGHFPRHRLCDALVGQFLLAAYLGLVTKSIAVVFETMFSHGAEIRIECWEKDEGAGGPFLGPCGCPMIAPATLKNTPILLRGNPPRDGISRWTFGSIAAALHAGDLSIWFWLLHALYAGREPGDLAYTFGSHNTSRLPIHYKADNIGYESEDDSRGWGPGKNPLGKGTPPRGVTRPSKDAIYFNLTHYNKMTNPRNAISNRFKDNVKRGERFLLKYLGHLGGVSEIVSAILKHGNLVTPETHPPSVVATSASAVSSSVRSFNYSSDPFQVAAPYGKNVRNCGMPKKGRKNLYGVVADVDSTDFEESDEDDIWV